MGNINGIYLGKFHHDLTVLPNPGIMVSKGNHPQMAELFRLVKYYNLYPDIWEPILENMENMGTNKKAIFAGIFCWAKVWENRPRIVFLFVRETRPGPVPEESEASEVDDRHGIGASRLQTGLDTMWGPQSITFSW